MFSEIRELFSFINRDRRDLRLCRPDRLKSTDLNVWSNTLCNFKSTDYLYHEIAIFNTIDEMIKYRLKLINNNQLSLCQLIDDTYQVMTLNLPIPEGIGMYEIVGKENVELIATYYRNWHRVIQGNCCQYNTAYAKTDKNNVYYLSIGQYL